MAIVLDCSPEVISMIAYMKRTGVPFKVTSTIRPGSITISGNLSYHSRATAVDFAGPCPSWDSDTLLAIYKAFLPVEKHLAELIYAGPGATYNIKNGKRVPKYAQSIHHNHVHVALKAGASLDGFGPEAREDAEESSEPVDANERTDLPVAITVPHPHGRGYVVLQIRDGGVFTYDGAPFFGSLVNHADGPAVGLAWTPSGEGYWILDKEGAVYSFGDAQYKGGVNDGELKQHFGCRIPVGIVASGNGYKIVGEDLSNDGSPFDAYGAGV